MARRTRRFRHLPVAGSGALLAVHPLPSYSGYNAVSAVPPTEGHVGVRLVAMSFVLL